MLVPFVVDADSLTPDPQWAPSTLRACHNDLLAMWNRFGLLVHDGASLEQSRLRQAVERLPSKQRDQWVRMLRHAPPVACATWNGQVVPAGAALLCSVASLALVDDARAEVEFEIDEESDEVRFSPSADRHLVVSRLQAAAHASVVEEAMSLSQRNIEEGEGFEKIWNARFRSLASAPSLKNVAIVDRFAMERHFKLSRDYPSGLKRFLNLLDADAGGIRYLTLFSAWTDWFGENGYGYEDIEKEMDNLMYRLDKCNVKRLTVYLIPNRAFGNESHGRYVRFERYVWELDNGLDIFEGATAQQPRQVSFKADCEFHRQREVDLRNEPKAKRIVLKR